MLLTVLYVDLFPFVLCFQPIYFTSAVPYETPEGENQEIEGVEEEREAAEEQDGEEMEGADAEEGNENNNENVRKDKSPPLRFQTYKQAVKKYFLHHTDSDMVGRKTFISITIFVELKRNDKRKKRFRIKEKRVLIC